MACSYILNFRSDDLEYICEQQGMPYFPLDEPWENGDVFDGYSKAVRLTQKYTKELQAFHMKYYQDYCQYKHGFSVTLTTIQNPLLKKDKERREAIVKNPLEGILQTFHQGTIMQYEKSNRSLPAMGLLLKQETQKPLRELHDEGNLLFFTMHTVDLDEVIRITEHACILLHTLWRNIMWRCEEKENDEFYKVAFSTESLRTICEVGFPNT